MCDAYLGRLIPPEDFLVVAARKSGYGAALAGYCEGCVAGMIRFIDSLKPSRRHGTRVHHFEVTAVDFAQIRYEVVHVIGPTIVRFT